MSPKQLLGTIAGALMILGPFLPLVSVPIVGDVTWFQGGKGDGMIVAILGLATLILAAANQTRWIWIAGGVTLAMVVYTFYNLQAALGDMKRDLSADLEDNPFGALATAAANAVQIKWGLAVVLVGAVLAIAAAAAKSKAGVVTAA
jgi:hypothetical protein